MKTIQTTILGNVGSAQLVDLGNNKKLLEVSVACNNKAGDKEFVEWVRVKIWGEHGEKLEPYIQKGDKLLVMGRIEAKGFLRKDGTPAAELVLHAHDVELCGSRKKSAKICDEE
jgi:single-stranded DNA-binding protein